MSNGNIFEAISAKIEAERTAYISAPVGKMTEEGKEKNGLEAVSTEMEPMETNRCDKEEEKLPKRAVETETNGPEKIGDQILVLADTVPKIDGRDGGKLVKKKSLEIIQERPKAPKPGSSMMKGPKMKTTVKRQAPPAAASGSFQPKKHTNIIGNYKEYKIHEMSASSQLLAKQMRFIFLIMTSNCKEMCKDTVECQACKKRLKLLSEGGSSKMQWILSHIFEHENQRFKCSFCKFQSFAPFEMKIHALHAHKSFKSVVQYVEEILHKFPVTRIVRSFQMLFPNETVSQSRKNQAEREDDVATLNVKSILFTKPWIAENKSDAGTSTNDITNFPNISDEEDEEDLEDEELEEEDLEDESFEESEEYGPEDLSTLSQLRQKEIPKTGISVLASNGNLENARKQPTKVLRNIFDKTMEVQKSASPPQPDTPGDSEENVAKSANVNSEVNSMEFKSPEVPYESEKPMDKIWKQLNSMILEKGQLECNSCHAQVTSGIGEQGLFDHMLARHYFRSLYDCVICKKKFKIFNLVANHVEEQHGLSPIPEVNFVDNTEKFDSEIAQCLAACYLQSELDIRPDTPAPPNFGRRVNFDEDAALYKFGENLSINDEDEQVDPDVDMEVEVVCEDGEFKENNENVLNCEICGFKTPHATTMVIHMNGHGYV